MIGEKMTRSDIVLAVAKLNQMTGADKSLLVLNLQHKIEEVYKIVFVLEKDEHMKELGGLLRKALES